MLAPCSGSSVYGAKDGCDSKESRVLECVGIVGLDISGSGEGDGEGSAFSMLIKGLYVSTRTQGRIEI